MRHTVIQMGIAFAGLFAVGCSHGSLHSVSNVNSLGSYGGTLRSKQVTSLKDPALITGTLPNGLKYYIRSNPYPANRANLWLSVKAGSINEDDDQLGFAHFLEHMAFNGTKSFPGNAVIDFVEQSGMTFGADLNAYTNFEETVYQLTIPTDNKKMFTGGLQIIDDWANGRILMDSAEVAAERGVVLGEWRARLMDTASKRSFDDMLVRVFGEGSIFLKRVPIGDPELLKTATPAPLARFYNDWYRPDLMAVIAVGDFDAKEVEKQILKRFSSKKAPVNPRKLERPVVTPVPTTVVYSLVDKMQPRVEVNWLATPLSDDPEMALRQEIIDELSTSFLQRTFAALSKKDRRSFAGASIVRSHGETRKSEDLMTLRLVAFPDSLMEALQIALTEVERVAQHGIPEAVLERDKQALLRRYISYSDGGSSISSRSYADQYSQHFLTGKGALLGPGQTLELVEKILPSISSNDIAINMQGWRKEGGRVATVNQPYGYPVGKVPVDDVKNMFREVASKSLGTKSLADGLFGSPTTIKESTASALSAMPAAGTIVSTRYYPNTDLTEWTLSNGARVVYKRNMSQPDNFLIRAHSLGGSSLMHDSVFTSPGRLVGMLMTASGGLGGVDLETMQQAAQKTGLREFHVGINTFDEEIIIGGSPRELEYLFQTTYLQFTAPTVDTLAMADWRRNGFSHSFMSMNDQYALQGGRHVRLVGPSLVNVPFVDLDQAMRVYKDRFGDASDFTFYVAGPLNVSEVLPLVTQYIASLPSTNRKERETPRDFKIPVTKGKGEGSQRTPQLLPEQSSMNLSFWGKLPSDSSEYLKGMHELSSTSWILGRRLRNVLRENMGVTYNADAPYVQYWTPDPRYSVSISVTVDSSMLDTTVKSVKHTIEQFRNEGPSEEELVMANSINVHRLENARQSNRWWINELEVLDRVGVSYDYLENRKGEASLTKEQVKDAAKKYFPENTYVLNKFRPVIAKKPPVKEDSSKSSR